MRKINVQREKVTFPRRHSKSERICYYAGIMLLLLAFVGSVSSLTDMSSCVAGEHVFLVRFLEIGW